MAQVSYFIISPNALVSIAGLIHGPDRTKATPADDWHKAVVDVVIPAYNEESTLPLCLASVFRQSFKPRNIIVIDDGSADRTLEYARITAEANGIELIAIHRQASIGKTPTLKRQSREFDSDVEFILDGDTILESEDYIARMVQELYQAPGIASACGTILPLRHCDRQTARNWPEVQKFKARCPDANLNVDRTWLEAIRHGITNVYRDALYLFLQKFVYRGQMVFFGSITNPVGCAVAYRRELLKDMFEKYEPIMGDDLTNSEDIFIGFALLDKGYRNIQLEDVCARSMEPEIHRLPRQVYLWSSSFLQSCYYFDQLLRSPFKSIKRWRSHRKAEKTFSEVRKIGEPYREAWGEEFTIKYGRPIGWTLLMSAAEKVFFPSTLLIMFILQMWEPLVITAIVETALTTCVLAWVGKGHRLLYAVKAILLTPLRYSYILWDIVTIGRFAIDLWVRRNRQWRK